MAAVIAGTSPNLAARALLGLDRLIGAGTELHAAALLAAEVILLGASVIARYLLHRPLIWSDELATALFLWLAMLGAVVALRRGEHLRLTAVVSRASPRARLSMDALAAVLAALFGAMLVRYGMDYAAGEAFITTPSMGLSAAWRAAALPAGGALMIEAALARSVIRRHPVRPLLAALTAVAGAMAALSLAGDAMAGLGNWNLVLFFVILLSAGLLIGLPIAFAFTLVTLAYLGLATDTPLDVVVGRIDGGMTNVVLLAIPLFVFLGKLMEATGMARSLVGFIVALVGHLRGGLSYALLGAMYAVSGISGAKTADMAAVAPVLFPEMRRRGGRGGEMVALLAASAVMSETIPPSLVLIAIATTVGISIASLFTAGLLPALLAAVALSALVFWRSRAEAPGAPRPRAAALGRAVLAALPGLVLPLLIRAAVMDGVATATEVSTVGIAYVACVGAWTGGGFPWRRLFPMLVDTAVLSGALLLILGAANAMAWALTQSGFSDQLAQTLASMPGGRYGFLLTSIVVFVVFGSVLEGLPAIALFGPLLFPIAHTLGINEIHFAMVAILAMGTGLYMPPFGVGYYSACAIGGIDPDEGIGTVWLYLGLLLAVTVVIAAIPSLSTCFLP